MNNWKMLRIIAVAEGVSFLMILLVTMPLKYYFQMLTPNKIIGMIHGLLFVLYLAYVILVRSEKKWDMKTTLFLLAASVIPCGTFYAEYKYFQNKPQ